MQAIDIGLTSLRATQVGLRTAGHNIANAATAGYHRQRVELADRRPVVMGSQVLGTGVDVAQIRRLRDGFVANALIGNDSLIANARSRLELSEHVDALVAPGTASLTAETTRLFDALEQLAANPGDAVLRRQVVTSGASLTRELNSLLGAVDTLQAGLRSRLDEAAVEIASLSADIARLSADIRVQTAQNRDPNDLLDRRDRLVSQLAELVDMSPVPGDETAVRTAAGGRLLIGDRPVTLRTEVTDDGRMQLYSTDGDAPLTPAAGRVAGLLAAHNQSLPALRTEVLDWFEGLRSGLDAWQATGLGGRGPFTALTATRPIADPAAPLMDSGPFTAGDLFVTVTETATGARTTHRIAIDPTVDSLLDVAALLDGVPHLAATVQPGSNQLALQAAHSYRFDFAGRVDPVPVPVSAAGTAAPSLGGLYNGEANTDWELVAVDSGVVGLSQPLRIEVRDAAGAAVLATLDVGQGYSAGSALALPHGLTLQLPTGMLAAGDTWHVSPVAQPDESGLVAGLGLRSFFSGLPGGPFAVHQQLLNDPGELATSRSGLTGEGGQLARLLAVRSGTPYEDGDTIESRLAAIVSGVGLDVQATRSEVEQLDALRGRLTADRDALSGVDVNEEMLSLLKFQQQFQASTRWLSIAQSTLDELLQLVR